MSRPADPASAADAREAALDRRVQALAAQLRCLVCRNESLADSQAPLAVDLRARMRAGMAAGRSDAQVVDDLVARYGDFVRYRPPLAPRTWLLWGGPPLALVAGLAALGAAVSRRRRLAAPAPRLDEAERARLSALLGADEEGSR